MRPFSSSNNQIVQDEEPWLGRHGPKDVSDMEMLIMRALGWSPRALTPASFLDQVLWDSLAGPLWQVHLQPGDYLSRARQYAANIVSSNMTGVVALQLCMPALFERLPIGSNVPGSHACVLICCKVHIYLLHGFIPTMPGANKEWRAVTVEP